MSEDEEIFDEITVQRIRNSDAECAAYHDRLQPSYRINKCQKKKKRRNKRGNMKSYTRDEAALFLTSHLGMSLYSESHACEYWYSEGGFTSRNYRGHVANCQLPNAKFTLLAAPEKSFVEKYVGGEVRTQEDAAHQFRAQLIEEMVDRKIREAKKDVYEQIFVYGKRGNL